MREIRVYGRLAKFLGQRVFHADVSSAAEVVRFLIANFPHLGQHMSDQQYRVKSGKRHLSENEIHDPIGKEVFSITPVVVGSGSVVRIIAGVALVALSFVTFGGSLLLGSFAGIAQGVGLSLALSGVANLLTPTPKLAGPGVSNFQNTAEANADPGDPRKNYSFSSIQNTSRQGAPIQIVYGRRLVGSIVISAGIEVGEVAQ
jgi:predicted phage tail protein